MAAADAEDDFVMTYENGTFNVHRRLDRTLEHRERYDSMSSKDRGLICDLRSSVEGCKKRVESLKDELERSEYECEKNEKLRHAAEERLRRHLVSMYASPDVDEELRHRLPRANNTFPLTAQTNTVSSATTIGENHQDMNCDDQDGIADLSEGFITQNSALGKMPSARALDFETEASPHNFVSMMDDSEQMDGLPHSAISHPHHSANAVPHHSRDALPHHSSNGVLHHSRDSLPHHAPRELPHHSSPTSWAPFLTTTSPITRSPHTPTTSPSHPPHNTQPIQALNHFNHSTPVTSSVKPSSNSVKPPPTSPKSSMKQTVCHNCSKQFPTYQDRQMSSSTNVQVEILTEKVSALIEANRKLTEKLATNNSEEDHQTIILDKIREIYDTQKRQDDAVMCRVRQAFEERDEVLHHLRQLQQSSLREGRSGAHEDISFDDDELDVSPGGIEAKGAEWVREVEEQQARLEEIARCEMDVVIAERDEALRKCHLVEKRLVQMERQNNAYSFSSTTEQSLQKKVEVIRKERDYALMKAHKTEEELQNFKIYYSLHRSLSKGGNQSSSDEYNNSLVVQPDQLRDNHSLIDNLQHDNEQLVAEVNRLAADNNRLTAEVKNVKMAYDDVKATKKQLETLVTVLRRKLKNTSQSS